MVPNLRVTLSEFCYGFLNSTLIHLFIVQLKLKLQMAQNLLDLAKSSFMLLAIVKKLWLDFLETSYWVIPHQMVQNFWGFDMTHLRIWQKFAKLLQYIRYDDPENFSVISCTY